MTTLNIDAGLQAYLPGVPAITDGELEQQLLASDGPLHPILIWDERDVIIDGHRRYAMCQKHNLPFEVERISFADEAAVKLWMDSFQLCRRNLTPEERAMVLARRVQAELKKVEPKTGVGRHGSGITQALEKVAEQAGVSKRTVQRANEHAKNLDKLAPDIRKRIESRDLPASVSDVATLAGYDELLQRGVVAEYDRGEFSSFSAALHGEGEEQDDEAEDVEARELSDSMSQNTISSPARRTTTSVDDKPASKSLADQIAVAQKHLGMLKKAIDEFGPSHSGRYSAITAALNKVGFLLEDYECQQSDAAAA